MPACGPKGLLGLIEGLVHERRWEISVKSSVDQLFGEWQRQFAADSVAVHANEIRRQIEYLGLDCAAADLLAGAEMLLLAVIAYSQLTSNTLWPV